jgi:hypothetical protein
LKKYKIYEFEYFDLNQIEQEFGKARVYGVGKFFSKLYKRTISFKDVDEDDGYLINKGFVYLSKIEIERYLGYNKKNGEFEWLSIIKKLSRQGLIQYRREGNNPYDFNKRLWYFRLNEEFFSCKKTFIDIQSKTLNKWLDKQNTTYISKPSKNSSKDEDELLLYEFEVCTKTDLNIQELDLVIDQRINSKLKEYRDKLEWSWLGEKSKSKILNKLLDEEKFKERYKSLLIEKYQILTADLDHLKSKQFFELSVDYFKRDSYGYRIYHIYSRCIKEYRDFIKIEGEDTVEIDLKNSMISMFYFFIKCLNNQSNFSKFTIIKEVFHKLKRFHGGELNPNRMGLLYLERWDYILNYGDGFGSDYYNFLKEESSLNYLSRSSFKDLLWLVLFGKDSQLQKLKLEHYSYYEIKQLLLGDSRFLVDDLRGISLYRKDIKNYRYYKNISLILHALERNIMDIVSQQMISKDYRYISLFDSFIVKKSQAKEIKEFLNNTLEGIDKVFKFREKK